MGYIIVRRMKMFQVASWNDVVHMGKTIVHWIPMMQGYIMPYLSACIRVRGQVQLVREACHGYP